MLFKLNTSVKEKINKPGRNSAFVYFINDNLKKNELKKFFDENNITLNEFISGKYFDKDINEIKIHRENSSPDLVIIDKIDPGKLTVDTFRNSLAGLIQNIKKESIENLYIFIPHYDNYKDKFEEELYYGQTFIEGVYLGNYSFENYKSKKKDTPRLNVSFITSARKVFNKAHTLTGKIMDAVYFTRDLVNEPAITLTPAELANRTKNKLRKSDVKVTVYNKKQLQQQKMNAVLAVGGASSNDPCLIVMHYKPKQKAEKKISLVGKGVTYDTGGLSIKPTSGMIEMKGDMAGAAAVIGTIKAAADLKLPVEIYGVIPAVENSVSGSSYKPGDIIKTASGKSIEVKDTDAEGRIILADALEFASKQKPDEIIDFATLTGAVVVALGEFVAGVMSKNDTVADRLYISGLKTYERTWRLPFWDDYNKLIESDIADVSNLGPRWGGAITAGKFLEKFVDENIPWAHVDLAGPALKHDANNYTKKWETGFGVRLMIDYLSKL